MYAFLPISGITRKGKRLEDSYARHRESGRANSGNWAPTPTQRPESLKAGSEPPFQFDLPPGTTGMVNLKSRKKRSAQAMKHPATQRDSQALHQAILPEPCSS